PSLDDLMQSKGYPFLALIKYLAVGIISLIGHLNIGGSGRPDTFTFFVYHIIYTTIAPLCKQSMFFYIIGNFQFVLSYKIRFLVLIIATGNRDGKNHQHKKYSGHIFLIERTYNKRSS